MPFTPYHFGPAAAFALPLMRWVNIPAALLVNIAVDFEPLIILSFNIRKYPEHGFFHTFLGATVAALITLLAFELLKRPLNSVMGLARLRQDVSKVWPAAVGALAGAWLHVVFDSFIYTDIRPFYPSDANPFYGKMTPPETRLTCLVLMAMAGVMYVVVLALRRSKKRQ